VASRRSNTPNTRFASATMARCPACQASYRAKPNKKFAQHHGWQIMCE
jgi:hypothetical protein